MKKNKNGSKYCSSNEKDTSDVYYISSFFKKDQLQRQENSKQHSRLGLRLLNYITERDSDYQLLYTYLVKKKIEDFTFKIIFLIYGFLYVHLYM